MRKLNWGVLGNAKIARNQLIPAIIKAENAVPYAIASRSSEKLASAVDDFGFKEGYKSYQALLDDDNVDVVYIPLPNGLHKEWAIKAAKAGKHVLCEKPMATTAQDCREMYAACKENNVKMQEAFMYRYSSRIKKMQEILDSGVIGTVKAINSSFHVNLTDKTNVRMDPALGGGSLWDVGCYPLNIAGLITGETPNLIKAHRIDENGVDISLAAILQYPSGVVATISCGFNCHSARFTEIHGEKGSLLLTNSFGDCDAPILVVDENDNITKHPVQKSERYVLQVEDFSNAILNGLPPTLTMEETVRNIGIIEKILEEAK